MSEHLHVITKLLATHCGVDQPVALESRLQEDLGLDSMGLLTLALEVENHFDLCLDEPPDQPPTTVAELIDLVIRRQEEVAEHADNPG